MAGKGTDVRARIEQFRRICAGHDAGEVLAATRGALGEVHYQLAARAAEVCAERLLYDLEPDLIAAYRHFLDDAAKKDPHCTAKGAIARALVTLDCQDADFYLAGIDYRQPEPVWGGSVDTAVDLRATCAMGLVGTVHARALIALIALLHDPEPHARSGAARAIACAEPLAAEAVLRSKALAGDPEPEVTADCLSALLQVAPEESPAFVARFLDDRDPALRELAALALGASRLDAALDLLRGRWEALPFKRDGDRVLLRAGVLHRSEAAFDWLLAVVAKGDRASAELLVQELAVYGANVKLRARLQETLQHRGDDALLACFAKSWESH